MRSDYFLFNRRALGILKPYFEGFVLSEQEILACKERWESVLALIPDIDIL